MNKYLYRWGLLSLGVILLVVGLLVSRNHQKKGICSEAIVVYDVDETERFISEASILSHLKNNHIEYLGKPITDIDLTKAEEVLKKQPFVRNVDCFIDLQNRFVIDLKQRRPIARVYPNTGQPYYLDEDGGSFPLSNLFSADVIVISGNILPSMIKKIYTAVSTVHQSNFWEGFIEHIFVKNNGELLMTTQIAGHQVILGSVNRLEGKLSKLESFYRRALKQQGWEQFKEINLEYRDQVICRK